MKKIILIFGLVFSTIVSCQRKNEIVVDKQNPNEVIEKHNQSLENLTQFLNIEDKDLLLKINDKIFSEDFKPNLILEDIEKSKKYNEDLTLGYFSIVKKTTYSLDSISIKDNYDKNKMLKIEKIKMNLETFESKIISYKIESFYVLSIYEKILNLRQNCNHKILKNQIAFSDDTCINKFNEYIKSLNLHITKLNEVKKDIENFPINE